MKLKSLLIILCVLTIICIPTFSFAADSAKIGDIVSGGDGFVQNGWAKQSSALINDQVINNITSPIYNILLAIGIGVAVIFATLLGIKFVTGSVEEKANVKDQLLPFGVGCIVVFGAFSIWKIVVTIVNTD